MYVNHMYAIPVEVKRALDPPGTQVTDSYSRLHAMLETEPESYGRAASNRNCWTISPALYCYWLQKQCSYMLWHISDITQLPLEWNYLYKLVNTVLCGNLTPTFNLTRKRFHIERKICAIMKLPSINLQKQNTLQRCVKLEYSPPIPTILIYYIQINLQNRRKKHMDVSFTILLLFRNLSKVIKAKPK